MPSAPWKLTKQAKRGVRMYVGTKDGKSFTVHKAVKAGRKFAKHKSCWLELMVY